MVETAATITCPTCGQSTKESMPTDQCVYFYDCRHCGALLKPKPGECCVYCSYADRPCPLVQNAKSGQADHL